MHTHKHTHAFIVPFSRTTQVSQFRIRNLDYTEARDSEWQTGSGINWAISKSAPRSKQITTPAPHHSVFYRPDVFPATQPTASEHTIIFYAMSAYTVRAPVHNQAELTDSLRTKNGEQTQLP